MSGHKPGLSTSLPKALVQMLVYAEYPCACITQCGGRKTCGAVCDTGLGIPSDGQLNSLDFWKNWVEPKLHRDGYKVTIIGSKCVITGKSKNIVEDTGDITSSFCWAVQELLLQLGYDIKE